MSAKLPFYSPAEAGMVKRSCSFTGFTHTRRHSRLSSGHTSLHNKRLAEKYTRTSTSTQLVGSFCGRQSEQVDGVFQALQKGLKEYLEAHKTELQLLSSQQRDTKRNSRLAFFYDLEKEIRDLERYIRQLDFQVSKVEELYEEYCIQCRLCQGAVNMKQAFSLSPSSRASQESLVELNRNHRQSLEDMWSMEAELEILLGELRMKMKGLIGFARLCPGDQYEVLIRLGRQRWRIRGRIQTDDRQMWDEEEMVFLPHIYESFEIKVTEMKGLSSILVGMVTCKFTDFYSAHPQVMVVDVTELGTIKLQLEVVWNPFDSGTVKNLSSARQQVTNSRKRPALSPLAYERTRHPTAFPDISMDWQSVVDDSLLQTPHEKGAERNDYPGDSNISSPNQGNIKQDSILFQGSRTLDILQQNSVVAPNHKVEPVKSKVVTDELIIEKGVEEKRKLLPLGFENFQERAVAMQVDLVKTQVATTLREMSFPTAELKNLNLQMQQLSQVLKNDVYIPQTSSSDAVDVEAEEVLGSFDFLSIDFITEDNNSCMSSSRLLDTSFKGNTLTCREVTSEDKIPLSEQHHTGHRSFPFSTGDCTLDQALEIHLSICTALLRALRVYNLEHMQQYILEELSLQTNVLKKIATFTQRKTRNISETELWSGAPMLRNVMILWDECCGSSPAFCCTADSFVRMLRRQFMHKVKATLPGQTDAVFAQLLQEVQSCSMMVPLAVCTANRVSVFQLHDYFSHWRITNFGDHISHMSREVYLGSCLETPKRRKALKKLKGWRISELQPMGQTLMLLAKLLTDDSHKVAVSAMSCLCRASGYKSFRLKALVHYTWLLKDNDIQVQQQACLALKCLKAHESAESVAELLHSTDEELRNTARQTILSFGKNGHKAFQRMDQICADLQQEIYKNLKTEITIF